jgi:hypothetical protein
MAGPGRPKPRRLAKEIPDLVVVEFNGSDVLALLEQLGERRIEFVASMKAWKTSPTSTFPTCAHRWR